jgi:hypothetical protein
MITRMSYMSFLAGLLLAVVVATPVSAVNLLTDPGFESNPLDTANNVLNNFTTYQNIWGVEMANIVTGPDGGVTPYQGSNMLKMTDDGQLATQGFQILDVSAYSGLINSGNAVVNMSAFFDPDQNLPAALAGVYVSFFNGPTYGSLTSFIGNAQTLDANPGTWEQVSVSGSIPVGTTWVLAQVAYNNATLNAQGARWGGYVDAADLNITAVPEPSTIALLSCGLVGLFFMARRKSK